MDFALAMLLLVALGFAAGFSVGYSLRAMRRGEHPNGLNKFAPESHKAGQDAPATPTDLLYFGKAAEWKE